MPKRAAVFVEKKMKWMNLFVLLLKLVSQNWRSIVSCANPHANLSSLWGLTAGAGRNAPRWSLIYLRSSWDPRRSSSPKCPNPAREAPATKNIQCGNVWTNQKKEKEEKKNLGLAGVANYKMCRNDPGDNWQCVKKNKRNKKLHNLLSKCDYKKNMKCTKKKSWEISLLFLFLKSNSEKKLIRIQRCVKALRKKKIISRPAEIYELQPLPVCVLCCLMAAGSERLTVCQCHSLSARRVRAGNRVGEKKNRKKKKKNIRKTRWKCTLRPAEEGSVFLSLLARTPKNKMLRASA